MKIKVNTSAWKDAVKKALSLVGSTSGDPNESCIGISITEGNSYFLVLENGAHNTYIKLNDIEIEEEGGCFIQYNSLSNLSKLEINPKEFTVTLQDNKLVYSVEKLGAVSEPIYHNQNPFNGKLFSSEQYTLLEEGNTPLINLLKNGVKVYVDTTGANKTPAFIDVLLNGDKSIISGFLSDSEASSLMYSFKSDNKTGFNIKSSLLKKLNFLLEDGAKIEKSANTLQITSSKGSTVVSIGKDSTIGLNHKLNSFENDEVDSSALLKAEELSSVVKMQKYGESATISIYSEDNQLKVKGDKTEQASTLEYTEFSPFNLVKLSTDLFAGAVSIIPKNSTVTLKITASEIGSKVIKTALLITETDDYTSTIDLQEPATNK